MAPKPRLLFFFLAGFLCTESRAQSQLFFDARYQLLRARSDELVETAGLSFLGSQTALRLFVRAGHSSLAFNHLDYAAIAEYSPLTWTRFSARFLHRNRFVDPSSTTTLFADFRIGTRFPSFLSYFFKIGIYLRTHQVQGNSLLPLLAGTSFVEANGATAIGLAVHPSDSHAFRGQISNIDSVEVYNLNNPFFEAAWLYRTADWSTTTYLRYQLLLGFGHYDAWVGGVQLRIGASSPAESDN